MKKIIALLLCAVLFLALVPVIAIPAMADEKITVPARPTLTSDAKTYIAFGATNGTAPKDVAEFGAASDALTTGGTIVVTGKGFYSFKYIDSNTGEAPRNTVDGTNGTILVTAKDGDTNYINTEVDASETGIILGNNNFAEANWDKTDYLLLKGSVIIDNVAFFNRGHKNTNEPMDNPNSVRALAGSTVVIGSGVQFTSRKAAGGVELNLPNTALDTEEGAVVFIDALGFSKYTGKGTLVIAKDLVDKVTADTFAGFEGKVVDVDGNALFAAAPQNPTPATGSMTVVIAAGAILASLGAVVALRKREER